MFPHLKMRLFLGRASVLRGDSLMLEMGHKILIVSVECFKCGKKGHIKRNCKNAPCLKYLEYCKDNYSCNNCQQKGHFAKDCQNEQAGETSSQKNKLNKTNKGRRHKCWFVNCKCEYH